MHTSERPIDDATSGLISERAREFEAPGHAVIATDLEGHVVYWGQSAAGIYGWKAGDVLGRSIIAITVGEQSQSEAAEIMDRLRSGGTWQGRFSVRHRDGWTFSASIRHLPIRDEHGTLIGIVGVSWRSD